MWMIVQQSSASLGIAAHAGNKSLIKINQNDLQTGT